MQAELAGICTPVILGDSFSAFRVALRLYLMYGVKSHIYTRKTPVLSALFPFIENHFMAFSSEEILLTALHDFSDEYESTLLYLIPIDKKSIDFSERNRNILENEFVITNDRFKFD